MPYTNDTIENNFRHHEGITAEQVEETNKIRNAAKEFAYIIDELCPNSREKSVAMTNLETCFMWANASIARND